MNALLDIYFQWPVLPFSVALCLVTLYWLLVIVGGIDMDGIDFEFDIDPDSTGSITDLGFLGLKWLNLGEVPLMVWLTVVAGASWLASMIFDRNLENPDSQQIIISIIRSLAIGVIAAKVVTNPLRGKLRLKQPNTIEQMLGRTCRVITSSVTPEFGHGECAVEDGAPLRLNIRTLEGAIDKGTEVEIIDYSPETSVYYVRLPE